MIDTSTRLKGGIFGLALGDALGVPVEFRSRVALDRDPVMEMRSGGIHGQPMGTWSDDSSLTFCLMQSLLNGEIDFHDIATQFHSWLRDANWTPYGSVFDRGMATTYAIIRFEKGMKAELCGGTDESDNGNGSLMRILPLVFVMDSLSISERFEMVKNVSSITHMHVRSVFSCFIYTEYVRLILNGLDKHEAYLELKNLVNGFVAEHDFNPMEISRFDRILKADISLLSRDVISGSGYVLNTLEASLWCFLTSKNYVEATLKAVNLGEDTDTTGAVTGGLAGVYFGFDELPREWVNQLARKQEIEVLIQHFEAVLPKFNNQ